MSENATRVTMSARPADRKGYDDNNNDDSSDDNQ